MAGFEPTNDGNDRRSFFKRGASIATASLVSASVMHVNSAKAAELGKRANRLPREVAIATVAQDGLRASNPMKMVEQILGRMSQAAKVEPDVICLPEIFPCANIDSVSPKLADIAEQSTGPILDRFAAFARDNNCYVVCPTYTKEKGKFYNSAVFLDRKGTVVGEYRKSHPTKSEMEEGITPGTLTPSVYQTDFGKVGAQICFDIQWDDGWRHLQSQGAEIVFWPSAFAGGQMVNARAWQHRYCVVSSTNKDVSKVCDFTGEELAVTSRWHPWVCATVNLEKAFMHTWPFVSRFDDVISKYGSLVRIRSFAFEEWSIIESLHPDIRVADLMKEFDLMPIDEYLKSTSKEQDRRRV